VAGNPNGQGVDHRIGNLLEPLPSPNGQFFFVLLMIEMSNLLEMLKE
jgi:hypothetical protein